MSYTREEIRQNNEFIVKLIEDGYANSSGDTKRKRMRLQEKDLTVLSNRAKANFLRRPTLLELDGPINVLGDIHGQFDDLVTIINRIGKPPGQKYLFLGDYVDRGEQGVEVIAFLFANAIKHPKSFYLLRGNHESEDMNRQYNFYRQVVDRYSHTLYYTLSDAFNCMPLAGVIGGKIFCVHGGISPSLRSLNDIRKIKRPVKIPLKGLICDLLWSDPGRRTKGFKSNHQRGTSYVYGKDVFTKFMSQCGISLLIRAHQVAPKGYHFVFGRRLINVFSAPNYEKGLDNPAGIVKIDVNLNVTFQKIWIVRHD